MFDCSLDIIINPIEWVMLIGYEIYYSLSMVHDDTFLQKHMFSISE